MATALHASFLLLFAGIATVLADDISCIGNTTCINYQECGETGCECPSRNYGYRCEFSIINALIIVVICTLPPVSWLLVCCYGAHAKGMSKTLRALRQSTEAQENGGSDSDQEVQQEVIDDGPPPTYAQVLNFDTTGTFEMIELNVLNEGQRSDVPLEMEPPPSYEWAKKAASLAHQESHAGGGSENITTISENMGTRLAVDEVGLATLGDLGACNSVCSTQDEEQC